MTIKLLIIDLRKMIKTMTERYNDDKTYNNDDKKNANNGQKDLSDDLYVTHCNVKHCPHT